MIAFGPTLREQLAGFAGKLNAAGYVRAAEVVEMVGRGSVSQRLIEAMREDQQELSLLHQQICAEEVEPEFVRSALHEGLQRADTQLNGAQTAIEEAAFHVLWYR